MSGRDFWVEKKLTGGLLLSKCRHCKKYTHTRVMPAGKKLLKSEGGERYSMVEVMIGFCANCARSKGEKYLAQDTQHLLIPMREAESPLT